MADRMRAAHQPVEAMLPIIISFGILWIACCAYAWLRGGWEGRRAATWLVFAALASPVAAYLSGSPGSKTVAMLAVDGVLLIALGVIAYRSDRFWPLWMVGLQLLSVCATITALIDREPLAGAYEAMQAFWSIPVLLVMALGVLLDRRADQGSRESGHGDISNPEVPDEQA